MSFEPIYEVATTDSPQNLCSGQVVAEAKLFAPPGITIAKILSVSASAFITASEVFAGEVRYNGKVVYRVILLGSEGETECIDCTADFSDKLLDDNIERGMKPIFDYRVLDTDIINVGSGEIKLATVVEVDLIKPLREKLKYLKFGGENIYTSNRNLVLGKECGFNEENVNVSDSAATDAEKILGTSCRVAITKKNCAEGFVSVEGKVIADICVFSGGNISSTTLVTPFAAEIALDGCTADCKAFVKAVIVSENSMVEQSDAGGLLKVDYVVGVTAIAYCAATVEVVGDAFSTSSELKTNTQSLNVKRLADSFFIEDCVTGTVTLDQRDPVADSVMAACSPSVHITSAYVKDGVPVVEGVVGAVILYYSAELNSKNSVAVELPFSLRFNHTVGDNDEIWVNARVSDLGVKIRRGGEFDVRADLLIETDVFETSVETFISELEEGNETVVCDSALTMHYASGGERLFDVAKAMKTAPETITEQNPTMEFPLKKGQRVVCYRHLKRE